MMMTREERIELGRRLASERDDMVVAGCDPTRLKIPVVPEAMFPKFQCPEFPETEES